MAMAFAEMRAYFLWHKVVEDLNSGFKSAFFMLKNEDRMNEEEIHIGRLILARLNDEKRSVAWLARQIPMDESGLRKQLKLQHIHCNLLLHICNILKTDFFHYYSLTIK